MVVHEAIEVLASGGNAASSLVDAFTGLNLGQNGPGRYICNHYNCPRFVIVRMLKLQFMAYMALGIFHR